MVSEKRFIVESVIITNDCNEDKSRIVKVITDKEELYSYDDLYEISDMLNEQAETIRKQSIRIYCQDKEVQRLLGELEKIPKSIREVWLED